MVQSAEDKLTTIYNLVDELEDALIQFVATRQVGSVVLELAAERNVEEVVEKVHSFCNQP
jgi:hypothetical protein